ncbi:MAG: acetyl-CoA carboxylase biotin carboxylase subunit [Alphaproteobacteria bacterium RIFCSPLOWO2_01_FULL_45_8]|nr:MAG: acetyl-CoA carboxylase biotin carboxylase subunit [Alphaproteobacteria bacterium GWB1_45_5]OFW76782.1 MAG: acetyl-CoA carboxylase biotin carboxylase subunit [Alphaproteobacteria bacterium GWA1_45_9]OFW89864.1 MAG: acetyl-CoA carboxylase biotin carboxylase subunit [Alphaproteobacteria bacterium RIFCSPHIGHO2_01_FULL_41_14]OFW96328.1 MAG: acetyl-CoA carboxylase biotin carboxylase subunit [Alphaproteobacteria bacterium RIFCSPLOWO2_01_FULL_45_8]HCI48999.1 acetyl-CoA carboxylase biotin carbox
MFKKVLIANRGEIALRILRACREMGIKTVVVHSKADTEAKYVRLADERVCIGSAPSKDSYLNMSRLLAAAEITGADAIHPGYGFFSENAVFARMVREHGMTFIGPSPEHIMLMGDKIMGKRTVQELGIPVVPGSDGAVDTEEQALEIAHSMGYPVLIKATSGGGGKGMQIAYDDIQLVEGHRLARLEAKANFGDDQVFIEKYLEKPRHIEIQILADHYGNVVHLGERDCSIQRRHQKLWEEAPSPAITPAERAAIGETVVAAMKKLGYQGLGTVEFLYENSQFYFIEMNTRVQVEHPVTEMITGLDLVQNQIRVAAGEPLGFTQEDVKLRGHAIECRVNAENPETFMPSPGTVTHYHVPGGFGVRVDSALYGGYKIPPYYDSLAAKLIVHGKDREDCLSRLKGALSEFVIGGIETTLPLHRKLVVNKDMKKGDYTIHWLEKVFFGKKKDEKTDEVDK